MNTRFSVRSVIAAGVSAAVLSVAACGGGGGASLSKFCKDQGNASTNPAELTSGSAPASASEFAAAAKDAKKLAGEAPSEIKDDVTKVYDGLNGAAQSGTAAWEDASVQAAWSRVVTFVGDKCN
ncbi:MAG TPA: hypothetical protein VL856_16455 [Acidimicrobiia bacterium]|nr:hypothetical protein [Acidimicrobiia bacterium]